MEQTYSPSQGYFKSELSPPVTRCATCAMGVLASWDICLSLSKASAASISKRSISLPPAADATTQAPVYTTNLTIHNMKYMLVIRRVCSARKSGHTTAERRAQLLRI